MSYLMLVGVRLLSCKTSDILVLCAVESSAGNRGIGY